MLVLATCFNTQSISSISRFPQRPSQNEHGLFVTLWAYAADPQFRSRGLFTMRSRSVVVSFFFFFFFYLLRIGERVQTAGVQDAIS